MKITLPKAYFELNFYSHVRILQIGAGGTGSALVPLLARLMASDSQKSFEYLIVDGDRVSVSNIVRQNFIKPDVGKAKAEVLTQRYASAFGVNLSCIPKYYTEETAGTIKLADFDVVVGCVDNNKARSLISLELSKLTAYSRPIYVDSGNELIGGQTFIQGVLGGCEVGPCLVEEHPEIATLDVKSERSCTDNLANGTQRLTTNQTAAVFLFNVIDQIIHKAKLPYYEINWTTSNSVTKKFLDDWIRSNQVPTLV